MASYIILTRPSSQNLPLSQILSQQSSAQIIDLPALSIHGRAFHELSLPEQHLIHAHAQMDLIFAVSSNAVQHFCRLVNESGTSLSPMPYYAAVGVSTQQAWLAQGIAPEQIIAPSIVQGNDSEALWQELKKLGLERFKQVLIARAQEGRNWLTEQLLAHDIEVHRVAVYERQTNRWSIQQVEQLKQALNSSHVVWLISSIQSAQALLQQLQSLQALGQLMQHRFVVVHQRIAQAIQTTASQISHSSVVLTENQFVTSSSQPEHLTQHLLNSLRGIS